MFSKTLISRYIKWSIQFIYKRSTLCLKNYYGKIMVIIYIELYFRCTRTKVLFRFLYLFAGRTNTSTDRTWSCRIFFAPWNWKILAQTHQSRYCIFQRWIKPLANFIQLLCDQWRIQRDFDTADAVSAHKCF